MCQQSLPWHASARSSLVAPPLALPAQDAQKSRSLRPVGLSQYARCLASCNWALLPHIPGIHRCFFLTISSSCTASFLIPFSASFLCLCSPTFLYLDTQAQEAKGSASCRSDAVLPCLLLAHPCTDEACVGVKGNWKELWLSQPAVAACPDHTASAL